MPRHVHDDGVSQPCDNATTTIENRAGLCHLGRIITHAQTMTNRLILPFMALLAILIAAAIPTAAVAQDWAAEGFDVVAYRDDGRATPGRGDIATQWKGKVWHFETEAHRAAFEADPHRYAPAFGGLCPVSLSEGQRRDGDPRLFAIIDGKTILVRSNEALDRLRADSTAILDAARAAYAP